MQATELGRVRLGVKDLSAWDTFAAEVIGLEVEQGPNVNSRYLRMDYWHHRIQLVEDQCDDVQSLHWRVAGGQELAECERVLSHLNIPFRKASRQEAADEHVLEFLSIVDPSGLDTIIFHGPRVDRDRPLRPGRAMHDRFVTGEGGLGHVVLEQNDPVAAEKFYSTVLGLVGSIELVREPKGVDLYFMSCNRRQHSLAFSRAGRPKHISHLSTEVADFADLGLTRQIARKRQIPFRMDIGQHHNDEAISFYLNTPSGWAWEVAWGVKAPAGQSQYGLGDIWGHDHG